MNNLLIVLIFLGLCISLSNGFNKLDGNGNTFRNELKHNKLLKVSCDDIEGEHLLKIGEEYEFTLGDVFFHSCTMSQGPDNFKHHQKIDAFTDGLSRQCEDPRTQCKWIAREDGIYFSDVDYLPTKRFKWDVYHLFKN